MTETAHAAEPQRHDAARAPSLVVSFPKSGRTWVEMMVAKVRSLQTGREVRDFLADLDRPAASGPGGARIEFTHGKDNHRICRGLGFTREVYDGRTVALVVRDPRDVLVSFYYYERFGDAPSFSGSLGEFLRFDPSSAPEGSRAARYGVRAILHWMNAWAANRDVPERLHVASYEDFHHDTKSELARLCAFLGLTTSPEMIDSAVQFGSFDNMRRLELSRALQWHGLRASDDRRGLKTRRGEVGAARAELAPDDADWLDEVISRNLHPFFDRYRRSPRDRPE